MIVVTGASRGLGKAICERLNAQGHEILGLARNPSESKFRQESCNVGSYIEIKNIANRLKKEGAKVKALINAAGIASMNLAVTTPPEVSQNIITTNLLGTIYCCQLFSPLMIRNKTGNIINFSTIAVALAIRGESVYAASKAGVEAFTRSFAREMSDFGINVNCIAPGPVNTDLIRGITAQQIEKIVARQIIPKQFTADSVCDLVEILLDSRSNSLSGQILNIGGV